MKINKISKSNLITHKDDIIVNMFTRYEGFTLRQLIPAEYDSLFLKYLEIKEQRSKPIDLPGQQTLWEEPKT